MFQGWDHTPLCRDSNKPIQGSLFNNQDFMESNMCFFSWQDITPHGKSCRFLFCRSAPQILTYLSSVIMARRWGKLLSVMAVVGKASGCKHLRVWQSKGRQWVFLWSFQASKKTKKWDQNGYRLPFLKLTACTWKWMLGIRSFPFRMANFQRLWGV